MCWNEVIGKKIVAVFEAASLINLIKISLKVKEKANGGGGGGW